MRKKQSVADMAEEVLQRQASDRAYRSGEPFDKAFEAVLDTEAGQQLEEFRDGPRGNERAQEWQKNLLREHTGERHRDQGRTK